MKNSQMLRAGFNLLFFFSLISGAWGLRLLGDLLEGGKIEKAHYWGLFSCNVLALIIFCVIGNIFYKKKRKKPFWHKEWIGTMAVEAEYKGLFLQAVLLWIMVGAISLFPTQTELFLILTAIFIFSLFFVGWPDLKMSKK